MKTHKRIRIAPGTYYRKCFIQFLIIIRISTPAPSQCTYLHFRSQISAHKTFRTLCCINLTWDISFSYTAQTPSSFQVTEKSIGINCSGSGTAGSRCSKGVCLLPSPLKASCVLGLRQAVLYSSSGAVSSFWGPVLFFLYIPCRKESKLSSVALT